MTALSTADISRHLDKLKTRPRPRPERLTALFVVEQLAGQIECLISEHGWTVLEVMEEISTASEPPYSPHTLRNAWFRYKREMQELEAGHE